MSKFKFKQAMEVAHIGNLSMKMYVDKIIYANKTKSTGVPSTVPEEGTVKEDGTFIDGIKVHWFGVDEISRKEMLIERVFHSCLLVPWEIAVQGEEKAEKWRYDNNEQSLRGRLNTQSFD